MAERLAYIYVRSLLILEIMLFGLSLVLHVGVLLGLTGPFLQLRAVLTPVSVLVGASSFAFLKDSLLWWQQIKSCPKWIWRGCVGVVAYVVVFAFGQAFYSSGDGTLSDQSELVLGSGFPLIFDAFSLCILYPVLYSRYLEGAEVVRRVLHSISAIAVQIGLFAAYRAGYIPLRRS